MTGLLTWFLVLSGEHRAHRPTSLPGRKRAPLLWWNPECDRVVVKRRAALEGYFDNQTRENRQSCRRVDQEVKRFLRSQKRLSFLSFYEFLKLPNGRGRVLKTFRSLVFCGDRSRTRRSFLEFRSLRKELICSNIPSVEVKRFCWLCSTASSPSPSSPTLGGTLLFLLFPSLELRCVGRFLWLLLFVSSLREWYRSAWST